MEEEEAEEEEEEEEEERRGQLYLHFLRMTRRRKKNKIPGKGV
jgi:hypothetical protein